MEKYSLFRKVPDLEKPGHYEDGSILRATVLPDGMYQIEEWDDVEKTWKIRPGLDMSHYLRTWRADHSEMAAVGIPEEDWNWPTSPPATEEVGW